MTTPPTTTADLGPEHIPDPYEACEEDSCGHVCELYSDVAQDARAVWITESEDTYGREITYVCTCTHHGPPAEVTP